MAVRYPGSGRTTRAPAESGSEQDPTPRWGIHWSQVVLGLLLVLGIVALVLHARDAKGDNEREAELGVLRDLGCRLIQGYLLRRPAAADEVLAELVLQRQSTGV